MMGTQGDTGRGNFIRSMEPALRRFAVGDEGVRNMVFELASARFHRMARQHLAGFPRLVRWHESCDILQDASIRMLRAIDEVRPESVAAFFGLFALQLRRTLINLHHRSFGPCGQHRLHRSPSDVNRTFDVPHRLPGEVSPDDLLTLHEAVANLPKRLRVVVDLRFYAGLTVNEAAELAGVSPRQLARLWNEAKATLAVAIDKSGDNFWQPTPSAAAEMVG